MIYIYPAVVVMRGLLSPTWWWWGDYD
jgi:hypothetical protein